MPFIKETESAVGFNVMSAVGGGGLLGQRVAVWLLLAHRELESALPLSRVPRHHNTMVCIVEDGKDYIGSGEYHAVRSHFARAGYVDYHDLGESEREPIKRLIEDSDGRVATLPELGLLAATAGTETEGH